MKYKSLYVTLGILIVAAVFWKSCRNEEPANRAAPERGMPQRQRTNQEPKSRLEEIRDFFRHADTRMDFFGRVIDQDGQGVKGVTIQYTIGKSGNYLESGVLKNTDEIKISQSNTDGGFEIKGAKGLTLSIGPLEKIGYRDGSRNPRSFGFKGTPELHYADPKKPVEFVIVRSDVPSTKEIYQKRLRFAWNQGEVKISFGNKLGDFVIVPIRVWNPGDLRDFDWSVKVSMDRAELVSLEEYYAAIAPSGGYQRSYEYGARKGDPKWHGGLQAGYAFKTTDGLYGLIRLQVYPEREDFEVNGSLNVRINETGSRNLD